MGPLDSPIHWSASEIGRRIARGEISATEVTQAFVARIKEVNPRLNAVVVPRFSEAVQDATAADALQSRGEPLGKLHGVPITIKECFHLAGTASTIGLNNPQFLKPVEQDGISISRLRRAGAIVLGKTNLPQLMIWHESDNPVYGRTNNPWDLSRTCGGSTGGEAAIVAARGSPLGIGNDLGGSIRVPCHFCGIHGIRPTSLRMPRSGSARTLRGFETFITQTGPMSRHVEDLWLSLQVLTDQSDGYVAGDVVPAPLRDPAEVQIDKLKVVAWTSDGVFPPSTAVVRAVKEANAALRSQGVEVIELDAAEVEKQFHTNEAFDLYCSLIGADGGADARRLSQGSKLDHRVRRLLWIAGLSRPMRAVVVTGLKRAGQKWMARIVSHARPRSADAYWQLVERKNQLAARVLANMRQQGISAIVCPPHALPAMPHVKAFDLLAAASYAMVINLLGLPSGTFSMTRVAAGEDSSRERSRDRVLRRARETDAGSVGLPVGVQVSALPWREDIVLALLATLEKTASLRRDYPGSYVVPVE
ncbi:MAG TPA: amidase family protein [Pirellulaceae bacterium]|jgi:fatty acid amide hydrolase